MTRHLRLDAETDFLASIGPSRTPSTVTGETQTKISFCAKNPGSASGSARRQDGEAQKS